VTEAYRQPAKTEYYISWDTAGVVKPPAGPGWTMDSWHPCNVDRWTDAGPSRPIAAIILWRRDA